MAAGVLALVSAVLGVIGTVWGLALAELLRLARQLPLGFGPVMALLQLGVVTALAIGGIRAFAGHRRWLFGAVLAELVLAFWWRHAMRETSSLIGERLPAVPWLFGVLALVAAGLAGAPELRRAAAWWSARRDARRRQPTG